MKLLWSFLFSSCLSLGSLGNGHSVFIRCFDYSDETFKDICFVLLILMFVRFGSSALWVDSDAASPVYCFVKPKSVIVWCVGVEREGHKLDDTSSPLFRFTTTVVVFRRSYKLRLLSASVVVSVSSRLLRLFSFRFTTTVFSEDGPEIIDAAGSDSSSTIQMDQLNAKILSLESQIDEKAREVKGKDELAAEKEKLLKEKEDKIASLQTEVSSLQFGKVQARVVELEKQVEVLRNFLEQKNKEKTSTEARTNEAVKKLTELNSSLDKVAVYNKEMEARLQESLWGTEDQGFDEAGFFTERNQFQTLHFHSWVAVTDV
ncbi:hypothetical protein Bca52824_028620 [Brassica carinata]|uniref:Uncharacterized protein n=1 Tax=Brassica carinata TaxID=52824 RepID=A0A8X8AQF6_BRACI|nr:hypothetical protein Bca52824_028620 [Brassica carinata]